MSVEVAAEKRENLGEKLRRVAKNGGQQHTPVASLWTSPPPPPPSTTTKDTLHRVSARKLAATLWDLHHYDPVLAKMHHRAAPRLNHHHHQILPYNKAVTPTRSIKPIGSTRETSTELVKVLNRIWTLEEQHVSNMSLVDSLKKELDHARSEIKILVREQQADRHEMRRLIQKITEDKLTRKNKEQDRLSSMRNELLDERKLRKRSESLHRKLARDLRDVKTTLANVSKEMENEKRMRNILEDLCDEFAYGIRDYEKELHVARQKSDKDWSGRADRDRSMILHVCDSWLDERMQMKLQRGGENKSVVEKLSSEIEAFIDAKRKVNRKFRRNSIESIPINMGISAPLEEDGSMSSDSNCFELGEKYSKIQGKKKAEFSERAKGSSPSSMQVKFEEQMVQAMQGKEKSSERRPECKSTGRMNSNDMIENLIRNQYLLSENGNKQGDEEYEVSSSMWRSQPSPVRQWTENLPGSYEVEIAESSLKQGPEMKADSLKAKLFEGRSRGQRSCSRGVAGKGFEYIF